MTTSRQPRTETLPLDEKTVADYLRENTEFFQNNPSLLADLEIPHSVGPAVSLVEHQVTFMRERIMDMRRRTIELLASARVNVGLF